MYRAALPLLVATIVLAAACGGSTTTQPTNAPAGGTPAAPVGSGGVRIDLTLGGGPHAGDYDLPHPNPCRFDNPDDGAWAVTVTFPGATDSPSIVDLVLLEGSSYVDAWFGDDQFRAADVEFSVDDRTDTATLTASGEATGPGGGESFPLEITVECDRVARY